MDLPVRGDQLCIFLFSCVVNYYVGEEDYEEGEDCRHGSFVFFGLNPYFGEKVYSHHNLDWSTKHYYCGYGHSYVVYDLIPTSNHNPLAIFVQDDFVVYDLIPTSNHNHKEEAF